MSTEENKAVVRRFLEVYSRGDLDGAVEVLSPDIVVHGFPGLPPGRVAYKGIGAMFRAAFPDARNIVEDQVAEGDKVATRETFRGTHQGDFMGIPATGKEVVMRAMTIDRIADGKIVERWIQFDQMGMMQQLGVIPTPGQEGA